MTVSTSNNTVVYRGNGAATTFAVPFKVLDEDHLVVTRRVYATGVTAEVYVGTDYSYSGIGDSSGTLTLSGAALSDDYELVIERTVAYTQDLDIVNAGGFYPESVEQQLDLIVMGIQQLAEEIKRSVRVLPGDDLPLLATAPARENTVVGFDDDGDLTLLASSAFKGDPGGNVMAEGAFSTLSLRTVPVGNDLIRTLEYGTDTGVGGAFYIADAAVDAAYVTANPLTSKLDAGGRGWRLAPDQVITPYMFGAIGVTTFDGDITDLVDDTTALQAFFTFCHARRIEQANWGGAFGVTAGLIMGGAYGENNTHFTSITCFEGSILLGVKSAFTGAVLTDRCRRGVTFGPIAIIGNGFAWTDRTFDVGLLIEDQAQLQHFTTIFVAGAKIGGVINKSTGSDNTFANRFGNCYFYACGSGAYKSVHPTTFQTATYSNRVNSGSAASSGQRTTIDVTTLPPAAITSGTYGLPSFAFIGSEVYLVTDYNVALSTVTLHPWIDSGQAASGTIYYLFGCGFGSSGGDAGVLAGKIASSACSVGLCQGADYPGNFDAIIQECAVGEALGTGAAVVGGSTKAYFEACDVDFLWHAAVSRNSTHTLLSETALKISKLKVFRPRRADNSFIKNGQPEGFLCNWQGRWLRAISPPDVDGAKSTVSVYFDDPYGSAVDAYGDTVTINIGDATDDGGVLVNNVLKDFFCHRARCVHVVGTGATYSHPTGTITVNCIAGKTINGGGTSLGLSGFTRPAIIQIAIDTDTNYLVTILAGK